MIKYPEIEEFYKKYNLNMNEINIYKLDLSYKRIGDKIIEDLTKIKIKELKELNLFYNNISDIKVLEKVKFEKLETLYLGANEISKSDKNSIKQKLKIKELYI